MNICRQLTIIGFGLIGSSVARAAREHALVERIVCGDVSADVCERVRNLKLADHVTQDLAEAVRESDMVLISVPVGAYTSVIKQVKDDLAQDSIVTDTGSVKVSIIEQVRPQMPDHAIFVPAHPISGTENSGPDAGFSMLFRQKPCIITPLEDTPLKAIEKVSALWEGMGAMIELMQADLHDRIYGLTSHMPHIVAFSMMVAAARRSKEMNLDLLSYAGNSFLDVTRIAASDPVMWRDIFLHNKDAMLEHIRDYKALIEAMETAVMNDDADALDRIIRESRTARRTDEKM